MSDVQDIDELTLESTSQHQLTNSKFKASVGVQLKAPSTNSSMIYIGIDGVNDTAGSGYPLAADKSIFWPVRNPNKIFVMGASGDKINYVVF